MQERRTYCSQLFVLLVLFVISLYVVPISGNNGSGLIEVDVGVILDVDHMVGKVSQTCISMALEDFYALNQNHSTTRIVLHKRNSKGDVVEAASAEEKVISNLSRFVVIVWVFVVLVLTSSYTASLTSMLTVQKLSPYVTDIRVLIQSKEYVGYQKGSYVEGLLKSMAVDPTKLKNYRTFEQYDEALSRGSKNGGVAAIIDELPYIRLFLSNPKYCAKYTMVGSIYQTAGFGFAFPKGSPLIPDVSTAILHVTEQQVMTRITEEWFGGGATCVEQDARDTSDGLTLDTFKGLFIVAAVASLSALILFLSIFMYENWDTLASNDSSIREKLIAMAKAFDEEKDNSSNASKRKKNPGEGMAVAAAATADCPQSPATCDSQLAERIFSHDEGLSATETSTTIHETIEIVESNEERLSSDELLET